LAQRALAEEAARTRDEDHEHDAERDRVAPLREAGGDRQRLDAPMMKPPITAPVTLPIPPRMMIASP
jgi:hypothetical protein